MTTSSEEVGWGTEGGDAQENYLEDRIAQMIRKKSIPEEGTT